MFFNLDDLGEKTLNKIAEIAISRQFERVEKLSVSVKTDASRLAKGELESLVIHGTGLVSSDRLQIQELKMTFTAIAVSPFKALMGNIELTYPSQGHAYVVLSETDLESALLKQLQQTPISIGGQVTRVNIQKVNCHIFANEEIEFSLKIKVRESSEIKQITWRGNPRIKVNKKGVILDEIKFIEGEEILSSFTPIVTEAEKIFNLSLFQIDGISLQVDRLAIEKGKVILKAAAEITHFPNTKN